VSGTDPGTHNLGIGDLYVDMYTLEIRSFEARTLVATKMMDDDDLLVANHGHTYARTYSHKEALTEHFRRVRPLAVGCEDAFFNRRTPGAYAPLLKSIQSIREAVIEYNPFMKFNLYEASVIKSTVGAVGWSKKAGTNKSAVFDALMKSPEFKVPSRTPLSTLSEHAIDSLAIAYTQLQYMRS
jgi:hypothetical protein